jgi:hypothetical protein
MERTPEQKKVYYYLLSGNNALDLMDQYWDLLGEEGQKDLVTDVEEVEKADKETYPEVDYVKGYEQFVDRDTGNPIWS